MTRSTHGRFLEMCARSALQISDREELEELRRHLELGCAECDAFLERLAEIGAGTAAARPVPPPTALKQQLLDQVRADARETDASAAGESEGL